jgi:predicted RNA-binding protein YlqC (UPF0109 family)
VKAFVEFVVRSVATRPEAVEVDEAEEAGVRVFRIRVAPEDVGRVIGRQGQVIQAMRTILRAVAARRGERVQLELAQEQAS